MYQAYFMVHKDKPVEASIEHASVVVVAERQRSKGGFLKPVERIDYIAKLYYPIFLSKIGDNNYLVVDAIPLFAKEFDVKKIPEVEPFLQDLENATTLESFLGVLERYSNHFDEFASIEKEQLSGIFPLEWMEDVHDFFQNLTRVEEGITTLDEKIFEPDVEMIKSKIMEYKVQTENDVALLKKALGALEEKSLYWNDKVLEEEKNIAFKYMDQIKIEREEFEKVKSEIEAEEREKIEEVERSYKAKFEELKSKLGELKKREKEALDLLREAKEAQDNTLIMIAENDLKNVKKQMEMVNRKLKTLEEEKRFEISRLKEHYKNLIESERRRIMVTETKRDEEVKEKEKVRLSLLSYSDYIKDRINRLIADRVKFLEELDKAIVKFLHVPGEGAIVKIYIPFYVIQYSSQKKVRAFSLFPVKIGNPGYFARLFGRQVPVEERNRLVYGIQTHLDNLLQSNPEVYRQVSEKASQNNLLLKSEFIARLRKGLNELVKSQWLEETEANTILNNIQTQLQPPPPP